MRSDEEIKICEYCHISVSIYESLTEYGKHYHEHCYIHKTQKEIEGYKKKWINRTMTDGDKLDLVDKYNLVEKLKTERTIYKGNVPVFMKTNSTNEATIKTMLCHNKAGVPVLDGDGKPVFIEEKVVCKEFAYVKARPAVERIKTGYKPKLLTVKDIPLLMESLP